MNVTISNENMTAVFTTLGAELISLKDKNGTERMWSGDPKYWDGHAPILYPVAGHLLDDYYILNNKKYILPKHGFALEREFAVEKQSANSVTFLLAGENAKSEGYPFDNELRLIYTLEGDELKVEYLVTNLMDTPLYFGIGAHEAYAVPGGYGEYEIVFDADEGKGVYMSELDDDLILRSQRLLPFNDKGALPLTKEACDSIILINLKSRGVTLRHKSGKELVHVQFDGFNYLLFWTEPGSGFIAIEPWGNHPDFTDTNHQWPAKPGVIGVAAKSSKSLVHTIKLLY